MSEKRNLSIDNELSIGDKLGNETQLVEYKSLMLPKNIIKHYITEISNTCIFTERYEKIVLETIKRYFKKYLPKYTASFSRTPYNGKCAKLILGVDDDGTISGIPTLQCINQNTIKKFITSTLKLMRGVKNGIGSKEIKKKFIDAINVEIIVLKQQNNIKCDIQKLKQKAINLKNKYNNVMKDYYTSIVAWRNELEYYKTTLENMCNNMQYKTELIKYCIEMTAPKDIIELLQSDTVITFPIGTVQIRKHDPTTLDYWVTRYKEFHGDRLGKIKPVLPKIKSNDKYLLTQISKLKIMNGNWKNHDKNKKVIYQIIIINLKTNDDPTEWIEYKKDGYWISSIRTNSAKGDPCCHEV
jgi:hypothetical protein